MDEEEVEEERRAWDDSSDSLVDTRGWEAGRDSTIISPALVIGLIGPSSSAAIRTWSGPDNAAATAANCVCDCVRNCIPQPTSLLVLLATASATAELCSQLRLARVAVYTSASMTFSSRVAASALANPLVWAFKLIHAPARVKALLARARVSRARVFG